MDTHRVPAARSGRFGRFVGAILITEGVLVAILRFLSLVYVVASEAYNADRFRTPLSHFLPSVLIAAVAAFALVWAGSFLRREPTGAWAEVGRDARVVLVAAGLLNVAGLATAVAGLMAIAGHRRGRPHVGRDRRVLSGRDRRARARCGPQPRHVDTRDGGMTLAASIRACPNASIGIPSPS